MDFPEHNVYDQRIQQTFKVTSYNEDIYNYGPCYQENTLSTEQVTYHQQTVWETQPVTATETKLVTEVDYESSTPTTGAFPGDILAGQTIGIDSGRNVSLTGVIRADETLGVAAVGNITVTGKLVAGTTLPTQTELIAGDRVSLTAGGSISIADSAKIETLKDLDHDPATAPTVNPAGVIAIQAAQNVLLGLEGFGSSDPGPARQQVALLTAGDRIEVRAGLSLTLSASLSAANSVLLSAGDAAAGTGKNGSIIGDAEGGVTTTRRR